VALFPSRCPFSLDVWGERWEFCLMAIAVPLDFDPVLAAIARAPVGEPFTPEEQAELAQDLADIAAGRARLVAHDEVAAALEEIRRDRRG
jgi:hypothetical protein